uniref:Interleukin-12 subunit beta n=1 Tax=Meriones unguiculatus TaxID=10047 RepID=Q924K7_MERUN|nr:interleukin-12 p40 subunit [Meriones unguiculatus]
MCHQKLTISWFAVVLLASPLMAIWELEKNVYVVEMDWRSGANESVVLTCDTSEEGDITWTKDQTTKVEQSGKTVTIEVKDFNEAGQYTCHKGDQTLSHFRLLLHKKKNGYWSNEILKQDKNSENQTFLKCEAANYSGRFTCSWLVERTDLKFSIKNSSSSPDSRAVTCGAVSLTAEKVKGDEKDGKLKQYSVTCQEDITCPTAEETVPIGLVLEAQEQNKYENYSTSFFIRDIITPDPPKNLKVKPLKNDKVEVSWEYPDSWSTPHSYFALKFYVWTESNKENKMRNTNSNKENKMRNACIQNGTWLVDTTSTKVRCKDGRVCVEAQDRYYNSLYSKHACVPCK